MKRENPPIFVAHPNGGIPRRQFLAGLGALAGLAGCGSVGSDSALLNGGGGSGLQGSSSASTAGVNTSQIGGTNLAVVSGLRPRASVGPDGTVVVTTSDTLAQVLFVMDGNNGLRGLALKLPGQPLMVDAATTALALVFLVPGISTSDATLAEARIRLLQQAPSFAALVQKLVQLLPSNTLTAILPQLQALLAAVTREAAGVSPKVSAKVDPFTPSQAGLKKPGGIFLTPGSELSPATGSFTINNESGRFVSVVRRLITSRNQSDGAQRTNLIGGPFPEAVSVVSSLNLYSVGNFLTGQTLTPGNARDDFSLVQHNPPLDRAVYYMRGLGYPNHPDNAELPSDVTTGMFELYADVATVLVNILLPLVEPVLAVAKLGPRILESLEGAISILNLAPLEAAAATGDNNNFASALFDLSVTFFTNPIVLEELALVVGGGVVAGAIESIFLPLLLAMSVANFLLTAADILTRPRFVAIEAPVPVPKFLDVLAEESVSVLDVNILGEVLYQNGGTTFKKKPFNAPQALSTDIDKATISDEGGVIAFSRLSDNSLGLRTDVATGTVPYPPGFGAVGISANPVIDPKGSAFAGDTLRTGPNPVRDIFFHQRATGETVALNFNSIPGSPGVPQIGGISASTVLAYARGPGSTLLGRYLRESNQWVSHSLAKPNIHSFARYTGINKFDDAVIYEYHEYDDLLNPVTSLEAILLEDRTGGITRVFDGGLGPGAPPTARAFPLGINDDGEILALETSNNPGSPGLDSSIFKTRGGVSRVPLTDLLPAGAPQGPYLAQAIGGKWVAATHLVGGTPGFTYLFFLGRTVQDVVALFGQTS